MRLISISLKYGPWRDALLSAYRKSRGSTVSRSAGVRERAEWILDILQSTCQEMNGVIPEAWIQHLGHAISHCSGPVPTLTALRVIRPAGKRACGRAGVQRLRFGKQPRWKRMCTGTQERAQAVTRIAACVRLADEIGDVRAVKTCTQWISEHEKLMSVLTRRATKVNAKPSRWPSTVKCEFDVLGGGLVHSYCFFILRSRLGFECMSFFLDLG